MGRVQTVRNPRACKNEEKFLNKRPLPSLAIVWLVDLKENSRQGNHRTTATKLW